MPPTTAPDERFWSQLLDHIARKRVVPVVGPDAVVVDGADGPRPLVHYLARWTEERLNLPRTEAPTLNDVASRYVAEGGRMDDVYWEVKESLEQHPLEVPEAIRKLARIEGFTLFVTTCFDDLLRRAIDQERFGGQQQTQVLAYSLQDVDDLPPVAGDRDKPTVYHLLGRVSGMPDYYALTEEDTLEFVHSLQSGGRRPEVLLDELRARSLLIIGSGYSDWLARFFLRIAKRERLREARSTVAVVADARARDDAALNEFLRSVRSIGGPHSADTRVFGGGAVEFIDELSRRWEAFEAARRGTAAPAASAAAPAPKAAAGGESEYRVFVSYASEDRPTAAALAEALKGVGVPVWFDRDGGLEGGDLYERKICEQIEKAAIFVPLLSPHVETAAPRFFRLEWNTAIQRSRFASEKFPFIIPVSVPGVSPSSEMIPEEFRKRHWMQVGDATGVKDVASDLLQRYRRYLMARGAA